MIFVYKPIRLNSTPKIFRRCFVIKMKKTDPSFFSHRSKGGCLAVLFRHATTFPYRRVVHHGTSIRKCAKKNLIRRESSVMSSRSTAEGFVASLGPQAELRVFLEQFPLKVCFLKKCSQFFEHAPNLCD